MVLGPEPLPVLEYARPGRVLTSMDVARDEHTSVSDVTRPDAASLSSSCVVISGHGGGPVIRGLRKDQTNSDGLMWEDDDLTKQQATHSGTDGGRKACTEQAHIEIGGIDEGFRQ